MLLPNSSLLLINDEKLKEICDDLDVAKVQKVERYNHTRAQFLLLIMQHHAYLLSVGASMYYSLPLRRRTDMNSYHQKIHEKRYTKTRTCEAKVTKRSLEKVTNLVFSL